MEYTVQKLARMAGVSTRTLRYYDELGILKPARMSSSGYRIYGQAEVNRLQQILFYRELGVSLNQIKDIVTDQSFDAAGALKEHRAQLLDRRKQLDQLIASVEKTIAWNEGRITMTDQEKFEGFKQKLIDENERKYDKEIRDKYGDSTVNQSNDKLKNMTQEQYDEATRLTNELTATLAEAFETGDPAGKLAQKAAELHRQWLMHYWSDYKFHEHKNFPPAGVFGGFFLLLYKNNERGKTYT
jgi:DNA-binding transcriptional MerR regulator